MNIAPSPEQPWRIAHRGYHAHCVENTLEAFAAAYGLGCDMVEFDVQLSRDGIPVIFHDDDLMRLAGRPEPVFALDASELVKISLRDPVTMALGRMPTLEELLVDFSSRPFYLEMKVPDAKSGAGEYWKTLVEKSLQGLRGAHPAAFAASFHAGAARHALGACGFSRVAAIHENLETLRAALDAAHSDPLSGRLFDSVSHPVFRQAILAGLPVKPEKVLLWHVGGREQFAEAKKSRVAGVVADDVPELMRSFQNSA